MRKGGATHRLVMRMVEQIMDRSLPEQAPLVQCANHEAAYNAYLSFIDLFRNLGITFTLEKNVIIVNGYRLTFRVPEPSDPLENAPL